MNRFVLFAALAGLAGCLNEDKFGEKFAEAWCTEQTACCTDPEGEQVGCDLITEAACGTSDAAEGEEDAESTCDFDKKAAKACLKGAFTCEDAGYVTPPSECADVCGPAPEEEEEEEDTDA